MIIVDDHVSIINDRQTRGNRIVFTNGCFDILTRAHVDYLQFCKYQGDLLVVALNSDESIKELKGDDRPYNTLVDRMAIMCAIGCVDYVMFFKTKRCTDTILLVKPDVYVKGGDYCLESLDKDERAALEEVGAEIKFTPKLDSLSTTDLLTRIRNSNNANIV
jgi:rfaE bifunctional protein nucleotidyltransferase chain/domain